MFFLWNATDDIWQRLSLTLLIQLVLIVFCGYSIIQWMLNKKVRNLPPGPRGWTATWEVLQALKSDTVVELSWKWARQYGPITYLNFFGKGIAFLNTGDMSRRIMASDKYKFIVANRAPNTPSKVALYNGKDWVFTPYDAIMRKKRRMFHNAISLYGDGVEKFENVVSGEIQRLMTELERHENQDFELWKHLARSLKVIVYILMTGVPLEDFSSTDVLEEFDISFNKLWSPEYDFVLDRFPFLGKIPGKFKSAIDRLKDVTPLAEELIYCVPKRSWIPGDARGVADHVFDSQNKPGYEWLQEDPEHSIAFLTSIFVAAHLTSRATLLGMFLCLVNYPSVARKIHEEIDRVIGDREPKLEHKSSMPYTEASILEILRLTTPIPFGGLRVASEDIHIDGMTIPNNTLVLVNAGYFHHNEDVWEDPWTFKPERYLDKFGQLFPADHPVRKNLLPFGTGIRGCPGEVFARCRVFMFVTRILQKYDVLPPANEAMVPADFRSNHDDVKGFIRQVQPFKCRLKRRQTSHL